MLISPPVEYSDLVAEDEDAELCRDTVEELEDTIELVADEFDALDVVDTADEPDTRDVAEELDTLFAPILPNNIMTITDNIIESTDAPNKDKANFIVVFLSIFHLIYEY